MKSTARQWCLTCGAEFIGVHYCGSYPASQGAAPVAPLTAEDVRRIIREELDRYKLPRKHGANMGPG